MSPEDCIKHALEIAKCGTFDGAHHKMWVIDQMIRALTDCPVETKEFKDCRGDSYRAEVLGESQEYRDFVKDICAGEDGPNTYEWDVGTPP